MAAVGSARTRVSQLWATVEAWCPTTSTAWAHEKVRNLLTLRVRIAGVGIQILIIAKKLQ